MSKDKREFVMSNPWLPWREDDRDPSEIAENLFQIVDSERYLVLHVEEYKKPLKVNSWRKNHDEWIISINTFNPFYKKYQKVDYEWKAGLHKLKTYTYTDQIYISRDILKSREAIQGRER